MTRWWSLRPKSRGGGVWKATNESLRLVGGLLARVEGGGKWKATNESSRLVGGP